MGPCRAVPLPLLLLGLALARATTPGPAGSTLAMAGSVPPSPPGLWAVGYEDAVSAAVELLNARAVSPYVLRLREAKPQPGWAGDLQRRQELSFIIEETVCRAPGTATAACKTRWLGAVSWCRGFVFLEGQQPTVELSCERVPAVLSRIRTSKLTDIFARIKERIRGFFQCGKIWIRDKLNLRKPDA
ncbi:cathelicidin-B1-like [Phoenicopterus ruber ruber]